MLTSLVSQDANNIKWTESPLICYLRVLKPRETALLTLIGACSAIIAKAEPIAWTHFALIFVALLSGSAGANGLTNYLDRHVDALMHRTQGRMLPRGLVKPHLTLFWCLGLVSIGLVAALVLHPYSFIAGLIALAAAVIARKTWATHFLGSVASNGPIFVAWLAVDPRLSVTLALIGSIIAIWVPLHVWNLMIAFRNDYQRAHVNIFPIHQTVYHTRWISLILASCLWFTGNLIWVLTPFGPLYGIIANALGMLMVVACVKMITDADNAASFRIFKLSTYPFLGITFLALTADHVLRGLL
jgi:protoheme IX farnesyltransferase